MACFVSVTMPHKNSCIFLYLLHSRKFPEGKEIFQLKTSANGNFSYNLCLDTHRDCSLTIRMGFVNCGKRTSKEETNVIRTGTECCDRMVRSPDLYSGGLGFKSRPRDRLSQRFIAIPLNPFRNPSMVPELGCCSFLSTSFQIHYSLFIMLFDAE
jgi:hypothetical protein